ncbi:MAG TPA: hypothetical protein VD838_11360 [Anaeromyxobacteraceae bacterium]|nr:hypothetical protein [Anaeromyxobacteraceae bacterium]
MLAPVLARLSDIPGVIDVRVECSGTFFLVTGRDAAALEAVLPRVRAVLGERAERLGASERSAQLAGRARGERWFSRDDIRGLSYVEGRILATRFSDAIAAAVPLERAIAERVHEAIRRELFAALDHAHDTGGRASTGWFWKEWPRIVEAIGARLDDVPAALRTRVVDALRAEGDAG